MLAKAVSNVHLKAKMKLQFFEIGVVFTNLISFRFWPGFHSPLITCGIKLKRSYRQICFSTYLEFEQFMTVPKMFHYVAPTIRLKNYFTHGKGLLMNIKYANFLRELVRRRKPRFCDGLYSVQVAKVHRSFPIRSFNKLSMLILFYQY